MIELERTSVLMTCFPQVVIEVSHIPMNAIRISIVNIPYTVLGSWRLVKTMSLALPRTIAAEGTNDNRDTSEIKFDLTFRQRLSQTSII